MQWSTSGLLQGEKKCRFVFEELVFDACVGYKRGDDLVAAIKEACPSRVDVYFDNVGGIVSDAVIPKLKTWARIALCGAISQYNAAVPRNGANRLPGFFVGRRVTMRGFLSSFRISPRSTNPRAATSLK
jgi:NADPH-dependent curcumin reductase CurA